MNELIPLNPYGFKSLNQEFLDLRRDFENAFFGNCDGSKNLAIMLTEGLEAYYKMIQIGAAAYPDDKSCMEAILNGLTAREYVLANMILMERGNAND